MEVKTVNKGTVVTVTKSVYCSSNGRLVTFFHSPQEYRLITNAKGEAQLYIPSSNEVVSEVSEDLSSRDEILSLYLNGRAGDLGLSLYGYRQTAISREDGLIKKTFEGSGKNGAPVVEIVYEDLLPIYCAYLKSDGTVISKTYFSDFEKSGNLSVPRRVTNIAYSSKKDSTITRSIYSNIKVDSTAPEFDFEIPANAKVAKMPQQSPIKK